MSKYLERITNYHVTRTWFPQHIDLITRPFGDVATMVSGLVRQFDIDQARGEQLDILGQWIGRSRQVKAPLTDVYFTFDKEGLGWEQGTWLGPYDPETGFTSLSDDVYRLVLKAQIAINGWDGSVAGLDSLLAVVFAGSGIEMQIIDNLDMSVTINAIALNGIAATSAELIAVIKAGELNVTAAGVRIKALNIIDPARPRFGFDMETDTVLGYDESYWS